MRRESANGPVTTWSAWRRAPASWALFFTGKLLSKVGYGVEKVGARMIAHAVKRLEAKAKSPAPVSPKKEKA